MPFRIEHGSATNLMSAAAAAGRATARSRTQAGMAALERASASAAIQRDELRLREKSLSLRDADARRSDRSREAELGLRERGMKLAERKETRVAKSDADRQAIVTGNTSEAISYLDAELAGGRLDQQAHRTMRVGILTGNRTLVSEGMRRYTKTRMSDEKARAEAVEDAEKYRVILNDPRASDQQRREAAMNLTNIHSSSGQRWGQDWKEQAFEHYAPDFTKIEVANRESQSITAKPLPYDRSTLKTGQVYQLPDGRLGSWTGSRFRVVGEPRAKSK